MTPAPLEGPGVGFPRSACLPRLAFPL